METTNIQALLASPLLYKKSQSKNLTKFTTWGILTCVMLLAIIISYLSLFTQSLRLDEAQSMWQASHTLSGIFYTVAGDVHVPLYHFILHFWQLFLGNTVATGRALSLMFFIASIPVVYLLGKTTIHTKVGLLAAVLVGISPFLNWYGSEVRMYTMLMFLTVVNQFFFLKIIKGPTTGTWWGYTLTGLLGIYTHYFFIFALAAQGVWFMAFRQQFTKGIFAKLTVVANVLGIALIPWLWYVWRLGFVGNATPHLQTPTTINLFNTFSEFLFGFQNDHLNTLIVSLWPITVLLAFFTISKRKAIPLAVSYFFVASFFPVIAAFLISILWQPLYVSRYLILAVPSLYLFMSWMLYTYGPRLRAVAISVLIIGMITSLAIEVSNANAPVKENYEQVAQFLADKATAGDIVAVSAPFTVYPLEYYYHGPASISTLPLWNRFKGDILPTYNATTLPDQVANITNNHDRIFLVLSFDQGYEKNIHQYFESHFQRLEEKNFSHNLNVYVYQIRY